MKYALHITTAFLFISGKIAPSESADKVCPNKTRCIWTAKPTRKLSKNITTPAQHSYASIFSQPIETFLSPAAGELEHKGRAAEAHNASSAVAGNVRCTWLPKHVQKERERKQAYGLALRMHNIFQKNNGLCDAATQIGLFINDDLPNIELSIMTFFTPVANIQHVNYLFSALTQVLNKPCTIALNAIGGYLDNGSFISISRTHLRMTLQALQETPQVFSLKAWSKEITDGYIPRIISPYCTAAIEQINALLDSEAIASDRDRNTALLLRSFFNNIRTCHDRHLLITQEFWKITDAERRKDRSFLSNIINAEKLHRHSFNAYRLKSKLPFLALERVQSFLKPTAHQLAIHCQLAAAEMWKCL